MGVGVGGTENFPTFEVPACHSDLSALVTLEISLQDSKRLLWPFAKDLAGKLVASCTAV